MDVDGTLTDGSINIGVNGELYKTFNVKDGLGLKNLSNHGVILAIITGRYSDIVQYRANELGINEVYQNVSDKLSVLKSLEIKYKLTPEEIAYIGDDINDLPSLRYAGLSFAPNDAVEEVLNIVKIKLTRCSGHGAVRECTDYIIKLNNGDVWYENNLCNSSKV